MIEIVEVDDFLHNLEKASNIDLQVVTPTLPLFKANSVSDDETT